MNKEEVLSLIDNFRSVLISQATDEYGQSDKDYKPMREALIAIPEIKDHIPQFIISNRNASSFFRYMQGQSGTYKGRIKIINDEMSKLSAFIEFESVEDPFSGIKQYKKCESIGNGGFGEVFRYHNECLDMDFAVKIYSPLFKSEEEMVEGEKRFFREAKMLFSLNNENIVRIYDAGRTDGKPFIRMEFIKGESLKDYINENGFQDTNFVKKAIIQILNGLNCAHIAKIIHRDLKPSNIMIIPIEDDSLSEKYRYKIIDFGISAFMESEEYTKLTRTGETIAGGHCIDPLLTSNPKLRDIRSDIYSVGAIMYFMLCGREPCGSDIIETLHKINPNVPVELDEIINKSLSSDIEKRYTSCSDFIEAIQLLVPESNVEF
ncbi:serine/threonine protein kinase [Ruminococcus flavefaciens]|uniref:Serine/threonine protein kinase n=1 Tax=Ruminococcus flavefaciens TaxID=1265 RepID=A0A1H6KQQ0_RUMFL|nr:serine/threonine-protein kinase [Ruminococcus flavefaciens]SEH74188.1 serine/threonine protein kinase [Ruminococcus flavefaciens]